MDKSTFHITIRDYRDSNIIKTIPVKGRAVEIPGWPEIKAFVHRYTWERDGEIRTAKTGWSISDQISGMRLLPKAESTIKSAINKTAEYFNNLADRMGRQRILEFIKTQQEETKKRLKKSSVKWNPLPKAIIENESF